MENGIVFDNGASNGEGFKSLALIDSEIRLGCRGFSGFLGSRVPKYGYGYEIEIVTVSEDGASNGEGFTSLALIASDIRLGLKTFFFYVLRAKGPNWAAIDTKLKTTSFSRTVRRILKVSSL